MLRSLALVASLVAAVSAKRTLWTDLESGEYTYDAWLVEHGARYPGSRAVFESNLAKILAHNVNPINTWKAGVNKFSALTPSEFKAEIQGYDKSGKFSALRNAATPADLSQHVAVEALPPSVDWRTKGVVTPVKDQGQCGGCWTFSAAETIESAVAIATRKLLVLSEQELIDCVPNPEQCGGTGGCSGATQELAFNQTIVEGLALESTYPYKAQTGRCPNPPPKAAATITGFVTLPFNNYSALMNAVAMVGPIAISAAAEPWQTYESGVFSSNCGADVDHAIQLVGYGHDDTAGLDYYLVRNSWSSSWGENGYIRVARYGSTPKGEQCLTDNTPGDGDGCANGPPSIQVCGLCGILSDSSYPTGAGLA